MSSIIEDLKKMHLGMPKEENEQAISQSNLAKVAALKSN